MPEFIFHICSPSEAANLRSTGAVRPASLATEGFVHCCFRGQIAGVLQRYFRGAGELALLELDARSVGPTRVEAPPGASEGFPHVYGSLPLAALRRVHALKPHDGGHALPSELAADDAREAAELDALLASQRWFDHPEGPRFVETQRDAHRTCGLWLLTPGRSAAFHRVRNGAELWIAQRGSILLHVLDSDGAATTHRLGLDVAHGEQPVVAVPRDAWQAAELAPGEPFAMGANVCAPPFEFNAWELGARSALTALWPQHRALFERLAQES
jgi:predicted cupin superfamily sugar epimerase/uncharacterized protein (DUF952 family)